jgi:hypothetical protein
VSSWAIALDSSKAKGENADLPALKSTEKMENEIAREIDDLGPFSFADSTL